MVNGLFLIFMGIFLSFQALATDIKEGGEKTDEGYKCHGFFAQKIKLSGINPRDYGQGDVVFYGLQKGREPQDALFLKQLLNNKVLCFCVGLYSDYYQKDIDASLSESGLTFSHPFKDKDGENINKIIDKRRPCLTFLHNGVLFKETNSNSDLGQTLSSLVTLLKEKDVAVKAVSYFEGDMYVLTSLTGRTLRYPMNIYYLDDGCKKWNAGVSSIHIYLQDSPETHWALAESEAQIMQTILTNPLLLGQTFPQYERWGQPISYTDIFDALKRYNIISKTFQYGRAPQDFSETLNGAHLNFDPNNPVLKTFLFWHKVDEVKFAIHLKEIYNPENFRNVFECAQRVISEDQKPLDVFSVFKILAEQDSDSKRELYENALHQITQGIIPLTLKSSAMTSYNKILERQEGPFEERLLKATDIARQARVKGDEKRTAAALALISFSLLDPKSGPDRIENLVRLTKKGINPHTLLEEMEVSLACPEKIDLALLHWPVLTPEPEEAYHYNQVLETMKKHSSTNLAHAFALYRDIKNRHKINNAMWCNIFEFMIKTPQENRDQCIGQVETLVDYCDDKKGTLLFYQFFRLLKILSKVPEEDQRNFMLTKALVLQAPYEDKNEENLENFMDVLKPLLSNTDKRENQFEHLKAFSTYIQDQTEQMLETRTLSRMPVSFGNACEFFQMFERASQVLATQDDLLPHVLTYITDKKIELSSYSAMDYLLETLLKLNNEGIQTFKEKLRTEDITSLWDLKWVARRT